MKQNKMLEALRKLLLKLKEAVSKLIILLKRKFTGNEKILVPLEQWTISQKLTSVLNKAGSEPSEDDVKEASIIEKEFMEFNPTNAKTVTTNRNLIEGIIDHDQKQVKELDKSCDMINTWLQMRDLSEDKQKELEDTFTYTRRGIAILSASIRINTKILSYAKPASKSKEKEVSATESFISFCDELLIPA